MRSYIKKYRFRLLGFLGLLSYVLFCQSCFTLRYNPKETQESFAIAQVAYVDSTAIINGQRIHYIETGQKGNDLLVFVHGSPGSWNSFEKYVQDSLLLERYQMIAVDRPGFGYSNYRDAQNLKDQAVAINLFLDKMAIKDSTNITLIGHSYGGPLIAKMAVLEPESYKNLIMLAGALDPKAEKPEKWRPVIASFPLRYLVPGSLRTSNKELWWLKDDLYVMDKELDKVTSNIYIFHGTDDVLVPFQNVDYMKTKFLNANMLKVDAIQGADHFIPWTHYTRVRDSLLKLH